MNPNKTKELKFPKIQAKPWKKVFSSKTDPLVIDLLSQILIYSPEKRLTSKEVLSHPYFDELRSPTCKVEGKPLPDLFNFTQGTLIKKKMYKFIEELLIQPELNEKLIPEWYKTTKET